MTTKIDLPSQSSGILPAADMPALAGDVTSSAGTVTTTIANNAVTTAKINNSAVTLAKIQNASSNSVLVGSGASGSGAPYAEIALGTNLSMSGTTLNASGGGGGGFPFTVVQESWYNTASNVSSITITFPQALAASGNTAFLVMACDGSSAVTIPAGWTSDLNVQQNIFARLIVCHKATAGETSVSVSVASASSFSIWFVELVGSRSLDTSSTGGIANNPTVILPAITPTAGAAVFGAAAFVTSGGGGSAVQLSAAPYQCYYFAAQASGGRALYLEAGRFTATNTSTTPPPILVYNSSFFASGGVAFATFSVK